MNGTTRICLNKHERLAKKDHKTRAVMEPISSDDRSIILPNKLSDFLSILPSSRIREEDFSITLLLFAPVELPKQTKIVLLLGTLTMWVWVCVLYFSSPTPTTDTSSIAKTSVAGMALFDIKASLSQSHAHKPQPIVVATSTSREMALTIY